MAQPPPPPPRSPRARHRPGPRSGRPARGQAGADCFSCSQADSWAGPQRTPTAFLVKCVNGVGILLNELPGQWREHRPRRHRAWALCFPRWSRGRVTLGGRPGSRAGHGGHVREIGICTAPECAPGGRSGAPPPPGGVSAGNPAAPAENPDPCTRQHMPPEPYLPPLDPPRCVPVLQQP